MEATNTSADNSLFNRFWRWTKDNPVAAILIALFLTEAAYKLGVELHISRLRISAGFKILLQLFFLYQIVLKKPKHLLYILGLVVCFLIGQSVLELPINWVNNLTTLDEYLFPLLMLMYVNTLNYTSRQSEVLFKVFETIIVINSILAIVGFVFHLGSLSTYMGPRWGYSGLLIKSGAATYIYIIAVFYFAYQCLVKKKNKWTGLTLVVFVSFILGTKAMLLALVLLALMFLITQGVYKKPAVYIPAVLLVLALVFFSKSIGEFILDRFPQLAEVYQQDGLWSMITSYRNQLFTEEFLPIVTEHWNFLNYLFGGCPDMHYRSQFELFDAFFFFGIIGSILYFFVFYKNFVSFQWNKYSVGICVILMIIAMLSGNFFYNSVVAIYLVILKLLFEHDTAEEPNNTAKA